MTDQTEPSEAADTDRAAEPPAPSPPPWEEYGVAAPTPQVAPAAPADPLRGILAGIGVAVLGAVAWALLVFLTHYEVGIAAVVIGLAVGWAVHRVGRVASIGMAIGAAVIAAFGILLGFIVANLIAGAHDLGIGFTDAVNVVTDQIGWGTFLSDSVSGLDWLFLAIGAFSAFRLVAQQRRLGR